jgi:predicted ATPase
LLLLFIQRRRINVNWFVVISGCSGGGKSTLLAELGRRGYATIEEPGRRIVREEREGSGAALPWVDLAAFARRAIATSLVDRTEAGAPHDWVFFDRGLVDAAAALARATGDAASLTRLGGAHRYHRRVFLTPPWPEIFATDPERRHGFDAAVAEYAQLLETYASLGYETVLLPKTPVTARADFILRVLAQPDIADRRPA